MPPSIAVVIPCRNEAGNLEQVLPQIKSVSGSFGQPITIYVVDGHSTDGSPEVAGRHGVNVITQRGNGYGGAIRTAIDTLSEDWIVTLDADGSHPIGTLASIVACIGQAEIVIASRYIAQGYARMPLLRKVLSLVLNRFFQLVLSMPVRDMSSGFRAYHRKSIAAIPVEMESFAFLQEILLKAYMRGYRILEIPFHYRPRSDGASKARIIAFGLQYLRLTGRMWALRNSVDSADYDTRAFYGRIPLQRWWQRRRYEIIMEMVGNSLAVLDVGCGSGQLLNGLPQTIGLDPQLNKLLFMRAPGRLLLRGSVFEIPFQDESFETVVCSQVIEHLPKDDRIIEQLVRCIAPGGQLILGTVDYGGWQWPLIEKIYGFVHPGGYAHEHITHYTTEMLMRELTARNLTVESIQYIARAEIIIKARKPGRAAAPAPIVLQAAFDRLLACPQDRSRLEKLADAYVCTRCRRRFPLVNDIPDFLADATAAP